MEGYWLIHYDSGAGHGDGIAVLHAGELLGGDLDHAWIGTFEQEGSRIEARIRIVPFLTRPERETMAREKPLILTLKGHSTGHFARLEGHPDDREDLPFHVMMRKCRASQALRQITGRAAA